MDTNIQLIVNQTNCDAKKAKQYYKKHNNNITDAILDILGLYNETKINHSKSHTHTQT